MNEHILRLARENAPCFIYSCDVLARQTGLLRDTFPGFDILFSVKANPFPPVLRALAALGIGADAASAREVLLAEECGMTAADINGVVGFANGMDRLDAVETDALSRLFRLGTLPVISVKRRVGEGRAAARRGARA